jgi:hypothetical protein
MGVLYGIGLIEGFGVRERHTIDASVGMIFSLFRLKLRFIPIFFFF